MSVMSTVWEETVGCAHQYRCDLAIHLVTVLSSSYGIIMDHAINSPVNGNNFVVGLNATDMLHLRNKWNLLVKRK